MGGYDGLAGTFIIALLACAVTNEANARGSKYVPTEMDGLREEASALNSLNYMQASHM